MDKKESFVFYRSFADTAALISDPSTRLILYEALITFGLTGEKPELEYPLNAILEQMTASVKSAAERYDKAKASGEKGGRPRKYIPPSEWQEYRVDHTQKETAEYFGVSVDTIQRWEKKTAKPQNLNVNVNVNDNENLNVNANSNSNYHNNIKNKSESPKPLEGGSVPRPGQPGFTFVHNGKPYIINKDGKVAEVGTA